MSDNFDKIKNDPKKIKEWAKKEIDEYKKLLKTMEGKSHSLKPNKKAVIVDLDGTLAHMVNREPFDWDLVENDEVDKTIKELVDFLATKYIILIVSGRDECCRMETMYWIHKNKIPCNELYMREHKDKRKDFIVKKDLYESNIKDNHNVLFVLDDRDQSVKGWRDLGLKCLQVQEGNY